MTDASLELATAIIERTAPGGIDVASFFDEATFTATHVLSDPGTGRVAIVDSVLDFDQASGRTSTKAANAVVAHVQGRGLTVEWLLETHAHADHLSAAVYLRERLGGRIAISRDIVDVQQTFGTVFNEDHRFTRDGSQFDHLFTDGERFELGGLEGVVLAVPGHTPADIAYVIGDAAFVGDTMFMPDYGTARTDFPGGDARQLYRSIQKLLSLPERTRIFLCHDYKAPGRDAFAWETTVAAERGNVHMRDGVGEDAFVAMREERDRSLGMPRLLLPSIQVNMRGGNLPEPEADGRRYFKLPINHL